MRKIETSEKERYKVRKSVSGKNREWERECVRERERKKERESKAAPKTPASSCHKLESIFI